MRAIVVALVCLVLVAAVHGYSSKSGHYYGKSTSNYYGNRSPYRRSSGSYLSYGHSGHRYGTYLYCTTVGGPYHSNYNNYYRSGGNAYRQTKKLYIFHPTYYAQICNVIEY